MAIAKTPFAKGENRLPMAIPALLAFLAATFTALLRMQVDREPGS